MDLRTAQGAVLMLKTSLQEAMLAFLSTSEGATCGGASLEDITADSPRGRPGLLSCARFAEIRACFDEKDLHGRPGVSEEDFVRLFGALLPEEAPPCTTGLLLREWFAEMDVSAQGRLSWADLTSAVLHGILRGDGHAGGSGDAPEAHS
eukprot:RCo010156